MEQHSCSCSACEAPGGNATKQSHGLMNFFLGQLDDEQRRLYVGLEAKKRGPGSERGLALIFGWDEQAIAVARRELEQKGQVGERASTEEKPESSALALYKAKVAGGVPLPSLKEKTAGFERLCSNQDQFKK